VEKGVKLVAMTDIGLDIRGVPALGDAETAALRQLLQACEKHDRAAVPENFDKTLNAASGMVSWFLAFAEDELRGFLSIFAPDLREAEVIAAVHPEWRREGIFSTLLEHAQAETRRFGYTSLLFVNDPASKIGNLVIGKLGARHDFSEYTLRYEPDDESRKRVAQAIAARTPDITVRRAESGDLETMVEITVSAFGDDAQSSRNFLTNSLAHPRRGLYLLGAQGPTVAMIGHLKEESGDYINAFAVHKDFQGKGLGKILLATLIDRISRDAESRGQKTEILMDVESTNDGAFGLYRSMGFKVSKSADYNRLSL
jgi:ribosomal protein S18 acetylase RimI-like enzyme